MVFEVKESNDVIGFNIGLSQNKMAANMAEICHLNDHNSSSVTGRDLLLVSTLWFSRSMNSMMSSDLILDDQKNKMAANMAEIWYSNCYISSSESYRPVIGGDFMVFNVEEFNDIIRYNIGRS